jgi:hypothetical protein
MPDEGLRRHRKVKWVHIFILNLFMTTDKGLSEMKEVRS